MTEQSGRRHSIRSKLISIFVAVKVLPLIFVAWLVWIAADHLTGDLKSGTGELTDSMSRTVDTIGDSVTAASIAALNESSRVAIEHMTTDTARAVADFLYGIDRDILYAASLAPDERAYRSFLAQRTRPVWYHRPWRRRGDDTGWEPAPGGPERTETKKIKPLLVDNAMEFHARPAEGGGFHVDQPLFAEMTFVGLDGREIIKVVTTDITEPGLRDVSRRADTWLKAETYFERVGRLQAGEIDVSRVIGAYVPSKVIGPYTMQRAAKGGVPFRPEEAGYAGKENPVGKRFQGIVRWSTPVARDGDVIGYVTLALDHTHIMEFTDHVIPTDERYSAISDAASGNYAFMWDFEGRNISHPRDYFIVGHDPESGELEVPWLEKSLYDAWQASGKSYGAFIKDVPIYDRQSREKKPSLELKKQGRVALDCRYLNFAPQCAGWWNLTQDGGSGSFVIFWSGLWKLTTAATIPYFTGQYGATRRGFGWVTIGANVNEFHRPALVAKEKLEGVIADSNRQLSDLNQRLLDQIETSNKDLLTDLTTSTLVMIILVVLLAIWLATLLTRKVAALVAGFKDFQNGNMETRLPVETRDELGELAHNFNEMADRVQGAFGRLEREIDERRKAEGRLEKTRDELEDRVRNRTQELNVAKEMAEQASVAKTHFLANMSHELRTPLNAIMGFSQMISGEIVGKIDRQEYIQFAHDILESSRHLLNLINDLLDIAKAETGKMGFDSQPTELNGIVGSCIHMLDGAVNAAGLQINPLLTSSPLEMTGDELRLKQIFLNVINNAIKYTPEGGEIRVSTDREPNGHLVVKVEDTGIGIAREDLPQVFEPFGQVHSSFTRGIEGAGLGLPLTKKLVEGHGGTIMLESVEEYGTAVTITFPADLAN